MICCKVTVVLIALHEMAAQHFYLPPISSRSERQHCTIGLMPEGQGTVRHTTVDMVDDNSLNYLENS
jgi:hypothetical protein